MDEFVAHANHNHEFYTRLCADYPDCYYDWKITCLFYISIHYLKALSNHRKKRIGHTHFEINNNIRRGKHNPTMPISDTAYANYMKLFNYSQTARYDGVENMIAFNEMRKADYEHAFKCFEDFKKFIVSSGIQVS